MSLVINPISDPISSKIWRKLGHISIHRKIWFDRNFSMKGWYLFLDKMINTNNSKNASLSPVQFALNSRLKNKGNYKGFDVSSRLGLIKYPFYFLTIRPLIWPNSLEKHHPKNSKTETKSIIKFRLIWSHFEIEEQREIKGFDVSSSRL